MKNSKMANYDDINETSKDIPDLEFCREEQKQTSDNIKVGFSKQPLLFLSSKIIKFGNMPMSTYCEMNSVIVYCRNIVHRNIAEVLIS